MTGATEQQSAAGSAEGLLARRGFVAGLTSAIMAVIAAVVGIPLAGYTILPAYTGLSEVEPRDLTNYMLSLK